MRNIGAYVIRTTASFVWLLQKLLCNALCAVSAENMFMQTIYADMLNAEVLSLVALVFELLG